MEDLRTMVSMSRMGGGVWDQRVMLATAVLALEGVSKRGVDRLIVRAIQQMKIDEDVTHQGDLLDLTKRDIPRYRLSICGS